MRTPVSATLLALATLLSACSQGESAPATAATPPPAAPRHLVETAPVTLQELAPSATRTGSLKARREIQILPQEEGRVIALPFFEGDHVPKDAELLRLDDSLLAAELKKTTAQRRQAELDLSRVERLAQKHLVSEEELARARTALDVAVADEQLLRTRLGYTRILAPFAGVISQRRADPGDVVPRYTHVLTLTDLSSLVTEVSVSELLLPALAVGDAVPIHIDALGGTPFPGHILRIHPTIDPATRQGIVEVALAPVPTGARPGQLCRVVLTGRALSRLTVPFAALRRDNEGEFVFVVDGNGKAQRAAVVSGMQLGERVELLSGPAAGAPVVIKGFLGLAAGMPVQAVSGPTDRVAQ